MQRRGPSWLLAFALSACCFCLAAIAAPTRTDAGRAVAIQEVRLWAGPDGTRVVLDLSGPVRHSLTTMRNPDRVVVDIPNARLTKSSRELPEGQGFVKQLRIGPPADGAVRVIVDLATPATAESFAVGPAGDYGYRLVIDLGKPAAAGPSVLPVPVKSAPAATGRDIVVAVDAGHGGTDPGSIGKRGTYEKDVTLAIARRLKERIDREPGMRAILTRDGDYFVVHRDRIARARRQQADMFISIHADAFHDRSVAGSSVYTLSVKGATDESARWLAHRENAADLMGGVSLDDKDGVLASVLLDLSQGASMTASVDAAARVLQELDRVGNVRRRAVQNAGFLVLKSPDIPSMLVETAFISNPGEELKLSDPKHQALLAEAIHAGVRNYFSGNPPPGTRFAQLRTRKDGAAVVAQSDPAVAIGGAAR
jgi:N-acetylmuramoyl-L-alanine amidase